MAVTSFWKEETLKVGPASKCTMHTIWDALYSAIREGKRFPITIEEGVEVVRVSELARKSAGW